MSDTPTPRTDSLMEEWHHCPPTKQLLNHSRQLERELAEARGVGMAWALAAQRCGLYRADVPHSTPEEWQSAQLSTTTSMLDELVSAKADSKMWMDVAMARLVSVEHYHTESLAFQEQLTAHKAALEKCEKALAATWADLDHLNHWMPTPCRELYMEAKLEIAKLKGSQ